MSRCFKATFQETSRFEWPEKTVSFYIVGFSRNQSIYWRNPLGTLGQEHHKLKYTDEALAACVKFASQYIQDRFLPDKVREIWLIII